MNMTGYKMHGLNANSKELKIQNAAIDMFADKGYNETTIIDIAERAGVSKNSIYHHFSNKKQILGSLLEHMWQELADGMIAIAKNKKLDPLEKIDAIIDQTIDIFSVNPRLTVVFFNEHNPVIRGNDDSLNGHYINYLKAFASIFDGGIRREYINTNIDGRVFLFFIHGGIRNLIHEWAMNHNAFPMEKIRESLKYQVKHGILKW